LGDEASTEGDLIAGNGEEFVDAFNEGVTAVGEVLVEVGLHHECGAALAHKVIEAVSLECKLHTALVPDVFNRNVRIDDGLTSSRREVRTTIQRQ
jgi:hypothetical protein